MDKITFREAQLLVIGAARQKDCRVAQLNNLQRFRIGDLMEVIEISLVAPAIIVRVAESVESYMTIDNLSEKVVDELIDILREIAYNEDEYNEHI